jgi:hypothetical protein
MSPNFQAAKILAKSMGRRVAQSVPQLRPTVATFATNGYNHDGPDGMHIAPHGTRKGTPKSDIQNGVVLQTPTTTNGQPQTAPLNMTGQPQTARIYTVADKQRMDVHHRDKNTKASPQDIKNEFLKPQVDTVTDQLDPWNKVIHASGLAASAAPHGKVEAKGELWQRVRKEKYDVNHNRNLKYPQMEHHHSFSTMAKKAATAPAPHMSNRLDIQDEADLEELAKQEEQEHDDQSTLVPKQPGDEHEYHGTSSNHDIDTHTTFGGNHAAVHDGDTTGAVLSDLNHEAVHFTRDKSHWEEFKYEYGAILSHTREEMETKAKEAETKMHEAKEYAARTTDNLQELGNALEEDVTEKAENAKMEAKSTLVDTKEYVTGSAGDVKELGKAIKDDLKDKSVNAKDQAQGTLRDTKEYAADTAGDVKELGKAVKEDLAAKAVHATNEVQGSLHESKEYVADSAGDVNELGKAIKEDIQESSIVDKAKSFASTAKNFIKAAAESVLGRGRPRK